MTSYMTVYALLCCIVRYCIVMAASSSAVVPAPPEGRELALRADDGRGVARQLVSLRGAIKSSLTRSLVELNQAGLLNTSVELPARMLKRRFQEASEYHGKQTTPYGSVVQRFSRTPTAPTMGRMPPIGSHT